jgi:NADH:ubiquinone oxidoreductase subunit 4 (subunit M)
MSDVNKVEFYSLGVLAVLVIIFGLYPKPILDITKTPVERIIEQVNR